jgi:hypothetical protein
MRFSHVNRLREGPSIKELFGMDDGMVGDDSISRFFHSVDKEIGREWVDRSSLRL